MLTTAKTNRRRSVKYPARISAAADAMKVMITGINWISMLFCICFTVDLPPN
jgi:hypothetical protein